MLDHCHHFTTSQLSLSYRTEPPPTTERPHHRTNITWNPTATMKLEAIPIHSVATISPADDDMNQAHHRLAGRLWFTSKEKRKIKRKAGGGRPRHFHDQPREARYDFSTRIMNLHSYLNLCIPSSKNAFYSFSNKFPKKKSDPLYFFQISSEKVII